MSGGGNVNYSETRTVAIAQNATVSDAIPLGEFQRGSVQFPSAITATSFSVQVSNDGSHWSQLQDGAGADVANTPCLASEACPLPSGAFNFAYGRISTNGAAEAAARTLTIHLRS